MSGSCICPRTKCPRHGVHAACAEFHSDPEKVLSFCKWAEITGFDLPDSKAAVRAWLSNDRTAWKA